MRRVGAAANVFDIEVPEERDIGLAGPHISYNAQSQGKRLTDEHTVRPELNLRQQRLRWKGGRRGRQRGPNG
ncbi:MAG: hypothetical protein WD733_16715 [Bryobacterales bacterium]